MTISCRVAISNNQLITAFLFRAADAKPYVTPSPGAYEAADTNRYKNKSPSFSLSTRYTVPSDHTMKPGPGAYSPEKVNIGIFHITKSSKMYYVCLSAKLTIYRLLHAVSVIRDGL